MRKFIVTVRIEEFRDFEIEAEDIQDLHDLQRSEKLFDKLDELEPVNIRDEYEGIEAIEEFQK